VKLVHTVAATAIAAVIGPAQAQVCIWPTQARIVVWSRANPATAHTAKPAQDPRPDIAHQPLSPRWRPERWHSNTHIQ
jgi:hypothetical protein